MEMSDVIDMAGTCRGHIQQKPCILRGVMHTDVEPVHVCTSSPLTVGKQLGVQGYRLAGASPCPCAHVPPNNGQCADCVSSAV